MIQLPARYVARARLNTFPVVSRTPIYGVDFSGASDAGRKIWIASGSSIDGRLHVEAVEPAAEKFDTGPQRETVLSALVEFIGGLGDALVGCDFPFSLPQVLLDEQDWETFVSGFGGRYRSADDFYEQTHRVTGRTEPKRYTDQVATTPWSPINLRIRWQTYHGISDVLAPLVAADAARVSPMQMPVAGRPLMIEVCPASLLKRLSLPASKYKGRTPAHREQRAVIVNGLIAMDLLAPPGESLHDRILSNTGGDALDAVLAAVAAFRAGTSHDGLHADLPHSPQNEGWVYV